MSSENEMVYSSRIYIFILFLVLICLGTTYATRVKIDLDDKEKEAYIDDPYRSRFNCDPHCDQPLPPGNGYIDDPYNGG